MFKKIRKSNIILVVAILAFAVGCVPDSKSLFEEQYKFYFPAVSAESGVFYGIVNQSSKWDDHKEDYPGMILKVHSHMARDNFLPGVYNWSFVDRISSGHEGQLWVISTGSTYWVNGGRELCRLPLPVHYPQYFSYIDELIEHTGADWYEVWNEPDTADTSAEMHIGCVGSTFSAGKEYANFANAVTDHIHSKYPWVNVVVGALIAPGEFARGMFSVSLRADAVSIHRYNYCGENKYDLPGDIEYYSSLTDLPIILSETSLLYILPSSTCEEKQADYATKLYDHGFVEGLSGVFWYGGPPNGWFNSDLETLQNVKKPAYYSYVLQYQ